MSEPRRRQRYIVLSIEHASVLKGAAQAYQAIMERWPHRQPPGPVLTEAIEAVRAEYRRTERRVCSACGGCDYGEPCCLSTCDCRATSPDSPLTNCTP